MAYTLHMLDPAYYFPESSHGCHESWGALPGIPPPPQVQAAVTSLHIPSLILPVPPRSSHTMGHSVYNPKEEPLQDGKKGLALLLLQPEGPDSSTVPPPSCPLVPDGPP